MCPPPLSQRPSLANCFRKSAMNPATQPTTHAGRAEAATAVPANGTPVVTIGACVATSSTIESESDAAMHPRNVNQYSPRINHRMRQYQAHRPGPPPSMPGPPPPSTGPPLASSCALEEWCERGISCATTTPALPHSLARSYSSLHSLLPRCGRRLQAATVTPAAPLGEARQSGR